MADNVDEKVSLCDFYLKHHISEIYIFVGLYENNSSFV